MARILSGKQNPASCCLPCITSTHNCILMDAEDTTLYDCHGPSDLSDPWVKGSIIHLYVQLPMTGLHDKAQRHVDEVNNLAPPIITCCSQILKPYQRLLHQTNEPLLMMPGQHKLYAEAKLHPLAWVLKKNMDEGHFLIQGFANTSTHIHFLNNRYCFLGTYYVPRVILGTFTHYFV